MGDTLIGEINGVKHYQDGRYTFKGTDIEYGGHLSNWFDSMSNDFNKLKGKLFNLVEATIPDAGQAAAIKGLIKGFCNDAFLETDDHMHAFLSELGFYGRGQAIKTAIAGPSYPLGDLLGDEAKGA